MQNRNNPGRPQLLRINDNIRAPQVRVVRDGVQLGVMPPFAARKLANEAGLDLVEIAPNVRPPVCHIMDYGDYRYKESLKERENRKKQKTVQEKVIQLRPVTDDHDLETKANQARGFLMEGKRVNFVLRFKHREIVHQDLGHQVIAKVVDSLSDVGSLEANPRMEGKSLICRMEPKSRGHKKS